jgi:hypothetical protein
VATDRPSLDACTDFKRLVRSNFDYSAINQHTHIRTSVRFIAAKKVNDALGPKIEQAGATGYILLWLLGIPIPILILIFLLRGCT